MSDCVNWAVPNLLSTWSEWPRTRGFAVWLANLSLWRSWSPKSPNPKYDRPRPKLYQNQKLKVILYKYHAIIFSYNNTCSNWPSILRLSQLKFHVSSMCWRRRPGVQMIIFVRLISFDSVFKSFGGGKPPKKIFSNDFGFFFNGFLLLLCLLWQVQLRNRGIFLIFWGLQMSDKLVLVLARWLVRPSRQIYSIWGGRGIRGPF
jgi:hypothetical protein